MLWREAVPLCSAMCCRFEGDRESGQVTEGIRICIKLCRGVRGQRRGEGGDDGCWYTTQIQYQYVQYVQRKYTQACPHIRIVYTNKCPHIQSLVGAHAQLHTEYAHARVGLAGLCSHSSPTASVMYAPLCIRVPNCCMHTHRQASTPATPHHINSICC